MKKSNSPIHDRNLGKRAVEQFMEQEAQLALPDFSDTEQTFKHLDDGDLRRMNLLFKLMAYTGLTNLLSSVGAWAVRQGLPLAEWTVKKTIFQQFVGGTSLITAQPAIKNLHAHGVTSILDFGAEAKNSEQDYNNFMKEVLGAIEFSAEAPAAIAVVVKVTGLAPDEMLAKINGETFDFDDEGHAQFQATLRRLDAICGQAAKRNVQVYIDAEESWMQNTIDQLANKMMARYNQEQVIVLNTFQLYRHDRLDFLMQSHERSRREGYLLGVKLVRGAYMLKERTRAKAQGYPSPIQPTLEATHNAFNTAVRFCADNVNTIACCIGSHNEDSVRLMTKLIAERKIPRNHPHLQFAQLLGMSDNLTFNLAGGGYNVSKYMVYGPVKEVLPYLIRRAEENGSVTGELGRERKLIKQELKRRRAEG